MELRHLESYPPLPPDNSPDPNSSAIARLKAIACEYSLQVTTVDNCG